jgi:hypothetical protein
MRERLGAWADAIAGDVHAGVPVTRAIRRHFDELKALREYGITWAAISDELNAKGVKATKDGLPSVYRRIAGERDG